MTYWHMQLHPSEPNWGKEKELLEQKALIGLGEWEGGQSQIQQFKKVMKKDDIVLIKRGATPIALVQIIDDNYVTQEKMGELDWFIYRRKVQVLEFATDNMDSFPQPRGALQRAINEYTRSYKYINNWYKKILNPDEEVSGLKIKKIHIESCKILQNFDIDFMDDSGNPLSLIVIAGKNGTGKTSIFDYITSLDMNGVQYSIQYELNGNSYTSLENVASINAFKDEIIYVRADDNFDEKLEKLILDYIDYFIYDLNENAAVGAQNLQEDMNDIFGFSDREDSNENSFKLDFAFKKIDYKTKKPLFERVDSIDDDTAFTLQDLSTGERTLLSKVFYLYLEKTNLKGKVILIDEPELSLHPHWQNRVLPVYQNLAKLNNCQIIIATHSPNILINTDSESLRFLVKEEGKIITKKLSGSPLDRDLNTFLKTLMGTDYMPKELEELHQEYRKLFDERKEDAKEAKELEKKILEWESPNSSFWQGLAFDRELRDL